MDSVTIYPRQFDVASRILVARMIKPTTIDVAIIDRETMPPGKRVSFDNICNRYIGCFDQREDGILCFYLAARQHPDSEITHLFIFHINTGYKTLQDIDVDRLKLYLPNIVNNDCNIKVGIIDIRCPSHSANYLSMLIETIEFTIGHLLIENYAPLQVVNTNIEAYSLSSIGSWSYCNDDLGSALISDLKQLAEQFQTSFHLLDEDTTIANPGFGFIQVDNDSVGYLYCEETQFVVYLLIHPCQFKDPSAYAKVKRCTTRCFPGCTRGFYCSRLIPNRFTGFDDKLVYLLFKTALILSPNIMTVVKENDLLSLREAFDQILSRPSSSCHRLAPVLRSSGHVSHDYSESTHVIALSSHASTVNNMDQQLEQSQRSNSSFDSDATDVISDQELAVELRLWREVSLDRQRIKDSIVPPIHSIKPFSDFSRTYLKCFPSYQEALIYIGSLWTRYVATAVCPRVSSRLDKGPPQENMRFIIYPTETTDGDDCLVIVDQVEREWIFLKPDNAAHKDTSYFEDIICRYVLLLFPELRGYKRRPVIISSVFHEGYPRVHLLMSLYVISRLFRYSVQLPQKIIYSEWEFRKYASNICSELQFVNSEYNIKQGLFVRGYLKEGALISYPSPLQLEARVVPKDQCMFCKKRGFKQLGAHYSMQHGGKAVKANHGRLTFE